MTVTDIIKTNLTALDSSFTFFEGNKAFANLMADNIVDNFAWLDYPIISTIRPTKGGNFDPSRTVKILLAKKSEMDYTPEQHRAIEEAMEVLCFKLITKLQSDSEILEVSNIKTIPVRNFVDSNITGCFITMTLRNILDMSVCIP